MGFVFYFIALLLAFIDVSLVVLPLFLFVILCLAAPFMPRLGFFLPVISRGNSGQKAVSITFDDGPDPYTTEPLLALLDRHGIKATFFVVGKKAAAHPRLIENILENGHLLGNHSYRHDNLLMLRSQKQLFKEIGTAQEVLARFHIRALAFRPPVGITNPKLGGVLKELKMIAVNFSCRGLDAGNRRVKGLSKRILRHLENDHIIALHDVMPKRDPALKQLWLKEVEKVLQGIKDRGFKVLPLSELIRKPVMIWESDSDGKKVFGCSRKKA
ncbi:MAG: polysaccharide deacetylase family protein [Deltaproteobacteria bacterium]|nr:polysaccharide deacetylase family protein [Deltaproteobacteria bacterium]